MKIGDKAIVINNKGNNHCFPKGTKVEFLGMLGKWYRFEGVMPSGSLLQQYLTKENFKKVSKRRGILWGM